MIIRKAIRVFIWTLVAVLMLFFLFPYLKAKFIYLKVSNDPSLMEFKRCKLIRYDFVVENPNPFTFVDLYTRKYRGIDFQYLDTLSEFHIKYNYMIKVQLNDYKIVTVSLLGRWDLSESVSVASLIKKMENDSSMINLIKNSDVKECHYEWPYFVYTGKHDIIKYDNQSGITYFKKEKPSVALRLSSYTQIFQKMVKEKGFDYDDFDSLRFIKISYTWRLQGFSIAFRNDFIEVGNYGDPLNLKFLPISDSIDPIFLLPQILKHLLSSGLSDIYIKQKLTLRETGATRLADYYKKGKEVIDASRVVGYFQYQWLTDSWLDQLHGGLRIKVYFTYFKDRKNIEMVRTGTSTGNFYENITLYPITKVINLDVIKQIAPNVDTSSIGFKITYEGRIMLTFLYEKYQYEVDAETGEFSKKRYFPGMADIFPYDQHLYRSMEWTVNNRRKKR